MRLEAPAAAGNPIPKSIACWIAPHRAVHVEPAITLRAD